MPLSFAKSRLQAAAATVFAQAVVEEIVDRWLAYRKSQTL